MADRLITRSAADRHEALYPRLATLTAQAEAMAIKRPDAAVAATLATTAETLLYQTQAFLPGRKGGLPAAAADMAGLATQLGQALAALDVYEAANTAWHPELKCRVWIVTGNPLPVRRLRPETNLRFKSEKEKRYSAFIKEDLIRRMIAKSETAYEQGYDDAKQNKPMRESRL
jgi:hypothetical protein